MRKPGTVDLRSLSALLLEWSIITLSIALALRFGNRWVYALSFVVVATRQHALLMIFHDAVHGSVARNRRTNDRLVNFFVGVPTLLPVEIYRPAHLEHHRALGTDADPERRFLYAGQLWRYRPLPGAQLVRQLAGDLFIVNGARTLTAWARSGSVPKTSSDTLAIAAIWASALAVFAWQAPLAAAVALGLWLAPLLTLTQLLQKIRSFAEHSGGPNQTAGWPEWTYTWRTGWLGRLTIWPYNINLHLEHHANPAVPWHGLPALAAASAQHRSGATLWRLLLER